MLTPTSRAGMKMVKSQSMRLLLASLGDSAMRPYIELAIALQATIV